LARVSHRSRKCSLDKIKIFINEKPGFFARALYMPKTKSK